MFVKIELPFAILILYQKLRHYNLNTKMKLNLKIKIEYGVV